VDIPTNKRSLKTLPEDIFSLFDPAFDHVVSEDNLEAFCVNMKEILRSRLRQPAPRGAVLRFSALGKPDRQLWMEANLTGEEEAIPNKTYLKFLYGDVVEQLILFLVKEAGHSVEMEQAEVQFNGVKGHIDAKIDGVIVDVKSASSFGYKKFKEGTVEQDDPFGYVSQLAGYADVLTPGREAAWLAFDKSSADVCVATLSSSLIKDSPPGPRIAHLKAVLESPEIPVRCYEPVPDGKSGNMKLAIGCSYCKFKKRCFPEARTFIYSTGPRFLTHVERLPDVYEVV
jgi:hypothetical protein